jgi:hypothetical protein
MPIVIVSDDTLDGKLRVHISKITSKAGNNITILDAFEWSGAAIGNTVLTSQGILHQDGPVDYNFGNLRFYTFQLAIFISGENSGSIKSKKNVIRDIRFGTFSIGCVFANDNIAIIHYENLFAFGNSPDAWRSPFGFYNDNREFDGSATVEGGDHCFANINFLSMQHAFLLSQTRGMKGTTMVADNCRGAAWRVRSSSTENHIIGGLAGISEYGADVDGSSDITFTGFRSRNTGSFSSGYDIRVEDGSTLFMQDIGWTGTRAIFDGSGNSMYNVKFGRYNDRPHSFYINSYTINTVAAGTTTYMGQAGEQSTNLAGFIIPYKCRSVRLKVQSGGTPGAGETYTYTLLDSGTDTALVATINDPDSSAEAMDQRVLFQEGDFVSVKLVTSAGATARRHRVLVEFE